MNIIRGSYPKTLNKIVELAEGTNVHVLENKAVTLHGVTFHGATLWTDFELFGNGRTTGMLCQDKMNDYKMIRRDPSYSRLRSVDTYTLLLLIAEVACGQPLKRRWLLRILL